jgi:vancomycin resistance protein YoaR
MRRSARLGLAAAGVVLAVSATLVVVGATDHSRTAPGTRLANLPAGGLTLSGLQALLQAEAAADPSMITVVAGRRTITLPYAELGLAVDIHATALKALSTSPSSGKLGMTTGRGRSVTPVLMVDANKTRRLILRLSTLANVLESHGQLRFVADAFSTVPPRSGQSVTASVISERLRAYVQSLPRPARLTVPVTTTPAHVSDEQLVRLADRARAQLKASMVVAAGARTVPITSSTLAAHLSVASEGSGPGHVLRLSLDRSARTELAAPLAAALTVKAVEPTVSAPAPKPLLRTQGSVTWRPRPVVTRLVASAKPGQRLTADGVLSALETSLRLPEPPSRVVVPPIAEGPKASDASARSINALLGTFTTPFACCLPRVTNIRLIARTVDGTLIAPGQSFSLNDVVGKRTKAKGYVEAPFILDGELSTDVGGGVSQFATTTFNAAFFAGLRLDRHQAHSFYISRYPPGREATVNYPSIDLQWTNTTSAPVLVRANTTATSLTVAIFGRGDGRIVQALSGPRQPAPGRNFRISVSRILTVPGLAPARETFTTPPKGE